MIHGDALKGRRKENLRIISIDQQIHKIDHELQNGEIIASQTLISANLGNATLSHELLKRLQHFWISKPEFVIKNGKARQKVKMTIDVSATHNLATQTAYKGNYTQLFKQLSDFDDMEVKNIQPNVKTQQNGQAHKAATSNIQNQGEEWILTNEKKASFVCKVPVAAYSNSR